MANVNFFSPDGGTTRYLLEDTEARSRIAGQQSLLKDTAGWTGKNRAYSQTNNAVIANIESGITYDVSWTGSATITLKKNSASGATITSGSTSPLSFTADADYELYFGSSATVTNIMVKDSRITDPTYEPYHESVEEEIEQIYADNGVLGAKNLLPYTRDSSTYTQSGVTYTRNADGSITANGTATANSFLPIAERLKYPINNLKKGVEYILSGDYGLGSDNGYVYVNFYNGSTRLGGVSTAGTGSVKFVIPESINGTVIDGIDFGIGVLNGKTVNNFTFYPMLRLASDPDNTYQPYAMTNRELTEGIKDANTLLNQIKLLKADDSACRTILLRNVTNTYFSISNAKYNALFMIISANGGSQNFMGILSRHYDDSVLKVVLGGTDLVESGFIVCENTGDKGFTLKFPNAHGGVQALVISLNGSTLGTVTYGTY